MATFNSPLIAEDLWKVAGVFGPEGTHYCERDVVEMWLELAAQQVNRAAFGKNADLATIFLAAHELDLTTAINATAIVGTPQGAASDLVTPNGALSSETEGPFSKAYRSNGRADARFVRGGADAFKGDALATTPWGQRFIALRDRTFACRAL